MDQEYRKGLMLHNPTIGDSGSYTCTGTMGNQTGSDIFIVLVKGSLAVYCTSTISTKFQCSYSSYNSEFFWQFKNYKGLELTTIGSSKDPLEGSNVTLHCLNSMFYSPPKWVYIRGENGKSIELNVTKLPEGF